MTGHPDREIIKAIMECVDLEALQRRFPGITRRDVERVLGLGAKSLASSHLDVRKVVLHVDGACRGNPGPAGIGVVLLDAAGGLVREHSKYLGKATNNVAEYRALIEGLKLACEYGAREVTIISDSELVVRQLTGEFRVKEEHLQVLFHEAQSLLARFGSWEMRHVPREENRRADKLAKRAIDAGV